MKIYLAAPYSHHHADVRESRVAETTRVAARLMEQGHVVFSPITHGHECAKYLPKALVENHDFWIQQCLPMLEDCDLMVVVPLEGWRESRGIMLEQATARMAKIPCFIWQEDHPAVTPLSREELVASDFGVMKGDSNG